MATEVSLKCGSTGYVQDVTSEKRATVVGFTDNLSLANIMVHEQGYCAYLSRTPTGADDEYFYLYNGSSDDLIIRKIILIDAAAETHYLAYCTGTAAGGTNLTPTNRYSGSANTFAAKSGSAAYCQSGNDITGLTLVANHDTFASGVGTVIERDYGDFPVVVPPTTAVCLSAATGTSAVLAWVYFEFSMEPIEA